MYRLYFAGWRRTKLTYPDDSYITYEYDAISRLTQIVDDSNNVLARYEYDELSRRTMVTLGNDANAVYDYDLGNRLIKLTNNIDDSNSITFEYANYDNVGNRLSMKIDDANAYAFTYDNLYQLTFVDYNDGSATSYAYDSLGNRTDVNDGTPNSYLRNNLNQYTSVGGTTYTYDNNGNLTDDGLFKFYYDCENRLTDVNDQNDVAVASYAYDYAGRRISKTIYGSPDVTTKYCYDGAQVIAEYDGSDNLLRKFIYGPGIDEPICIVDVADSNAVYYYHFDGLGSVVALSDVNNVIVESYSYDVFGAPTIYDVNNTEISSTAIGNPYMFTARRADDETALYYYRARYYAFDIGRFLQTDPVGYADGLNVYAYCGNNPMNWVDPSGLCKDSKSNLSSRMALKVTNKTHSVEETYQILAEVRNPLTYLLHYGPIGHGIPPYWGGYDYRAVFDEFTIVDDFGNIKVLKSSEFGNFLAGYAGTYYGGDIGLLMTFLAGDAYAGQDGLMEDDYESRKYIVMGSNAANDVLQDEYLARFIEAQRGYIEQIEAIREDMQHPSVQRLMDWYENQQ